MDVQTIAAARSVVRREASGGCVLFRRPTRDYIAFEKGVLDLLKACQMMDADAACDWLIENGKLQDTGNMRISCMQIIRLLEMAGVIVDKRFDGVILDNRFNDNSKKNFSAPERVHIQLTRYCNYDCPYCWSDSGVSREGGLTEQTLISLFRQLCEMGTYVIDIGGGEPFGRDKDLANIIRQANNFGLHVNLSTNAALARKNILDKLKDLSIDSFRVGLIAGSEKVYENECKGAWRTIIRNIKNIREKFPKSRLVFHVTLYKGNNTEIPAIMRRAEELGADEVIFDVALPVGRGAASGVAMNIQEVRKTLNILREIDGKNVTIPGIIPSRKAAARGFEGFGCACGRTSCYINSVGQVYPNGLLSGLRTAESFMAGDITKTPFYEIWNESKVLDRWRSASANPACKGCAYYNSCRGGCRTRALIMNGNISSCDPFCSQAADVQGSGHK